MFKEKTMISVHQVILPWPKMSSLDSSMPLVTSWVALPNWSICWMKPRLVFQQRQAEDQRCPRNHPSQFLTVPSSEFRVWYLKSCARWRWPLERVFLPGWTATFQEPWSSCWVNLLGTIRVEWVQEGQIRMHKFIKTIFFNLNKVSVYFSHCHNSFL